MTKSSIIGLVVAVAMCLTGSTWGTVVYQDVAAVTARSQKIVIGDVMEVTSFWDANHELIKSRIVVQVADYLVGEGSGIEVLEMSGGTVDGLTLRVSVLPTFEVGDHVLLFLDDGEIGLVAGFQGAYLTDGGEIARMAPGCRRIIHESRQTLVGLLSDVQMALPAGVKLPQASLYMGTYRLPEGEPRFGLCGYDWTWQAAPMGEPYLINANCTDSTAGDAASQIEQLQNGMTAWNTAGANFAFTYGGASTLSSVGFDGTNLILFSMSPPGGWYIAANYYWLDEPSNPDHLIESDIVFNDLDYSWWNGVGACSGSQDIWSTAAHELGHTLCLEDLYDAGDAEKTMYGFGVDCDILARTLDPDDIEGIVAIYGASTAPANDQCLGAANVTVGTYNGTTTGTRNDGSANCGNSTATPDVWYRYLAAAGGLVTVDTCGGATFDTVLSIHSGCPGSVANQLGCNDDACAGNRSMVSALVTSGHTYYIRVSGRNGATGDFTLNLAFGAATPPTPSPMTFQGLPTPNASTPSTAVDMSASLATCPTGGIQYAFEANEGPQYPGASSRDWEASRTYTDAVLMPNTRYIYRAKARDSLGNTTLPSANASVVTHIEKPADVSFGAVTDTTVVLGVSGTLTNLTLGMSGVYFEAITPGGDGEVNRWLQTATATLTGLSPDTNHVFQVKARNQVGVETPCSPPKGIWTLANTPGAPVLSNAGGKTLQVDVEPNGNPAATQFAVQCIATDPLDGGWVGVYVTAVGSPSTTPEWRTDGEWIVTTIRSLKPNTTYTFAAKARNQDSVETVCGPAASSTTLASGSSPPPAGQATGCGAGCAAGMVTVLPSVLLGLVWMKQRRKEKGVRSQ